MRDRLRAARDRRSRPGSGRQGGRGLERLADRLAGAGGDGLRPVRSGWRPRPRRRPRSGGCTGSDGRLRRASRDGRAGAAAGILEDYAALAQAFVRLAARPGRRDLARTGPGAARGDADQFETRDGGFFDTAADAEQHYTRPQDPTDNATPSGLSAAIHALGLMAELTGEHRYAERAERAAASAGGAGRSSAPVRRLAAGRCDEPGRAAYAGPGGRSWDRRTRPARELGAGGPPAGAGRFGDRRRASRTSRGSRCWPTGRCSTAGPPRTSAGISSAGCR